MLLLLLCWSPLTHSLTHPLQGVPPVVHLAAVPLLCATPAYTTLVWDRPPGSAARHTHIHIYTQQHKMSRLSSSQDHITNTNTQCDCVSAASSYIACDVGPVQGYKQMVNLSKSFERPPFPPPAPASSLPPPPLSPLPLPLLSSPSPHTCGCFAL